MINLIGDYDVTLSIIGSISNVDDKKFEDSDRMEYSEFEDKMNEYGIKATLNRYGLNEFITEDKPLAYFMLLWDRVHGGWSTPYKAFRDINEYRIVNYKTYDGYEKIDRYYNLLEEYVKSLIGIN
jgi:hypothetical protein